MSFTPASLGFTEATDDQIVQAVKDVIARTYDGQVALLERKPHGNLGLELRRICGHDKVIVPGPIRLARLLRQHLMPQWSLYPQGNFVTEVYARDAAPDW